MVNAAITVAAALLVLGVCAATVLGTQAQKRNADAASSYAPATVLKPIGQATSFASFSDAMQDVKDNSRPWSMTVLGDSTGNEPDEWVYLVTEELAAATGRPAVIHNWSSESHSYEGSNRMEGDGEPIIVWNGSASGESAAYTLEHRSTLSPGSPNLVVINHGHNHATSAEASSQIATLAGRVRNASEDPPALAITLQNPRTGGQENKHANVIRHLREDWTDREDVTVLDVFAAFDKADNLERLVHEDGTHPTEAGQRLWADTVLDVMQF
ncbi:SGNH/GDSL hydrolase family protein [Kocuria sp. WN036]|uniref:SGNH/GDSL hydrolase family protein n=1 Tax=Kocuria sp. WN036 TaxID=2032628 RepID=UPI001595D5AD|nr:SGNH/GDSL hydrolase family protein [Kocuria sp. WN036]